MARIRWTLIGTTAGLALGFCVAHGQSGRFVSSSGGLLGGAIGLILGAIIDRKGDPTPIRWRLAGMTAGLVLGAFVGFELAAWLFWNEFMGGAPGGLIFGVPGGGLLGGAIGATLGARMDRRGGLRVLRFRLRYLLVLVLVVAVLLALIRYMATLRPFFWFQT